MKWFRNHFEILLIPILWLLLNFVFRDHVAPNIPNNMPAIAGALASIFGSLVGFSLAALGIVFAIVQKKEYDALFRSDHAEVFFRAFKTNQAISFVGFIVTAVAMVDDVSKGEKVYTAIVVVVFSWALSFLKLASYFNSLVDAEIKIRKKALSK